MFDLEQAIAEWRRQMLTEGIQTPVPLEELESHLREDIERQIKAGLGPQKAFETSILRIGRPEILKYEFKKNGGTSPMKKIAIAAMLIGAIIILRILTEHPDAAHLRKNEQVQWVIAGSAILLFGLRSAILSRKADDARDIRLWKLVGIAYSTFGVWISMQAIIILTVPKFSAAVGMSDRILIFAAAVVSLLSVYGWRLGRGILPIIHNPRMRTVIGATSCALGPILVALFWFSIALHSDRFLITSATWVLTLMAVLGGVGYGLTEAARGESKTVHS